MLPTFLSASDLPASHVALSIAAFVVFYSALAVVELFLMVRAIRQGPDAPPAGAHDARPVHA